MGSTSDITRILKRIIESDQPLPPEATDDSLIKASEAEIEAESQEDSGEAQTTTRRATFAIRRAKEQINLDALVALDTPLAETQKQAGLIANIIDAFRVDRNIKSDLIGPELIDNIAISIVRLKVYYWLSYFIYHKLSDYQDTVPLNVVLGKLLNPNLKELAALEPFFTSLPPEYLDILSSRKDRLTEIMKNAEGSGEEYLKAITPEDTKRKKKKQTKESMIYKVLATIVEVAEPEESASGHSAIRDREEFGEFARYLPNRLLSGLVSKYVFATKNDLKLIDFKIYLYFANPKGLRDNIIRDKNILTGSKSKVVRDPETGKKIRVDDPNAPVQNVSTGVEDIDPEKNAPNPDLEQNQAFEMPTTTGVDAVREKAFSDAAPKIFNGNNIAIQYFNNKNFAAIVSQLLDLWKAEPKYNIQYLDAQTNALVTRSLSSFFREYGQYFIEDAPVATSAEAFEMLSEAMDVLISPSGEKLQITDATIVKIKKLFQALLPKAFDFSTLPVAAKNELSKHLGLTTTFDARVHKRTEDAGFKDLITNKIKIALDSERDTERQKVLKNALDALVSVEPDNIDLISKIADAVLSQNVIVRAKNKAEDVSQDDKMAGIASAADTLGSLIFSQLASFDPVNKVRSFRFNDVLYSDAHSLAKAIAQMPKSDIEFLYSEIQNGVYGVPMKGQLVPFYQLKGGPAKKNQDKMTANFNTLTSLKESRLVEDVEDPTLALLNSYTDMISKMSSPILQEWELIIKKVPLFLMNVSVNLKKYAEYLKNPASETTLGYGKLTSEQLSEIQKFIMFVVGKDGANGNTLKAFNEDLRLLILDPSKVQKLTTFFVSILKEPTSIFFKPVRADFIMSSYSLLTNWLLSIFHKFPSIHAELEHLLAKDAEEKTFVRLQLFLQRNMEVILPLAMKEHKADKLVRSIKGIASGLYEYIPEEPKNEEEQPLEVAQPNIESDEVLKKRMEELEALASNLDF